MSKPDSSDSDPSLLEVRIDRDRKVMRKGELGGRCEAYYQHTKPPTPPSLVLHNL
jgi:hypothetical protein